jgi:hypothetical protein
MTPEPSPWSVRTLTTAGPTDCDTDITEPCGADVVALTVVVSGVVDGAVACAVARVGA